MWFWFSCLLFLAWSYFRHLGVAARNFSVYTVVGNDVWPCCRCFCGMESSENWVSSFAFKLGEWLREASMLRQKFLLEPVDSPWRPRIISRSPVSTSRQFCSNKLTMALYCSIVGLFCCYYRQIRPSVPETFSTGLCFTTIFSSIFVIFASVILRKPHYYILP